VKEPAAVKPAQAPAPAPAPKPAPPAPVRAKPVHVAPGELRVVVLIGEKSTWGTVKVDGVEQGYAPATLQVPAGAHDVTVVRGAVTMTKKTRVTAGQTTVLKFDVTQ
jgi:hypothetical protein